jgi:hypothetical protein
MTASQYPSGNSIAGTIKNASFIEPAVRNSKRHIFVANTGFLQQKTTF